MTMRLFVCRPKKLRVRNDVMRWENRDDCGTDQLLSVKDIETLSTGVDIELKIGRRYLAQPDNHEPECLPAGYEVL
jgi:hypothetical protein